MRRARPRTLLSDTEIEAEVEDMMSSIKAEKAASVASLSGVLEGGATRRAGAAMARVVASHEAGATAGHAAGATRHVHETTGDHSCKVTVGLPVVEPSAGDGVDRSPGSLEGGTPPAPAADAARPGNVRVDSEQRRR